MPYQITLANGTVLTNLADNTVDKTTSLTLVGRNYPGYGGLIANNFVHLLENSANTQPPSAPLVGQLWYDTNPDSSGSLYMKVWTGQGWNPLSAGTSSVLGSSGSVTLQNLVAGGVAPLQSPQFSGLPTAPTAAVGSNSNQIATTAYVINQMGQVVGGVSSVVGSTGAVTLANLVQGGIAPIGSPSFTGTPTAPTPSVGANNNQIATTAFVINQVGALSTGVSSVVGNSGAVSLNQLITAGLAPVKSPQLQGVPTAPTAAAGTNTNQVATCAFVLSSIPQVTAVTGAGGSSATPSPTGTVAGGTTVPVRTLLTGDITLFVSPAGSDATGAGTQSSPYATMQHAYNVLQASYDGCGHNATIALMNGTHTSGLSMMGSLVGFPNGVAIQGYGQTQGQPGSANNAGAVVLSVPHGNGIVANYGAQFSVGGFTISGCTGTNTFTGQSGNSIVCNTGSVCNINPGMIFGAADQNHIIIQSGYVGCSASYQITGGAISHITCGEGGFLNYSGFPNNASIALVGNPAFTVFVLATTNSIVSTPGYTFSGSATGIRFFVTYHSIISTNGAGFNYFPGTADGTVDAASYGVYI